MAFDVTDFIVKVVAILIGAAFTYVIVPVGKAAFKWLMGRFNNEALQAAIADAEKTAAAVVANLQQDLVDGWKKAAEDGKLTPDEILQLNKKALADFMTQAAKGTVDVLQKNKPNLEDYLLGLIRDQLATLKTKLANGQTK
jgi:hypothetical protein